MGPRKCIAGISIAHLPRMPRTRSLCAGLTTDRPPGWVLEHLARSVACINLTRPDSTRLQRSRRLYATRGGNWANMSLNRDLNASREATNQNSELAVYGIPHLTPLGGSCGTPDQCQPSPSRFSTTVPVDAVMLVMTERAGQVRIPKRTQSLLSGFAYRHDMKRLLETTGVV